MERFRRRERSFMWCKPSCTLFFLIAWLPLPGRAQDNVQIPLVVSSGTPLRVYLTKRISKRLGERVEGKLLDPVYAFDHQVVPAGSVVLGSVVQVKPVPGRQRAFAILNGDFAPLRQAEVQFTTLVLPDGKRIPIHTLETPGLNSLANLHPKKPANPNAGVIGTAKAQVKNQIETARQNLSDTVRAAGKTERLEDYIWAKLPYHPQYVRRLTRFDAELSEPLPFGTEAIPAKQMDLLGTQPSSNSPVDAQLVTPIGSDCSKRGDPIEAILSAPLLGSDQKLVLPEGTHLIGTVTMTHRARWFHRGGQLRFNFEGIKLPQGIERPELTRTPASFRTLGYLQSVEPNGKTQMKVDQEGGVKATESKTRFLAPVLAAFVASRAADNDINKTTGAPYPNNGGHVLGGAFGFGLFGAAAARFSPGFARAFGFYGLGWSVFRNVVARGQEVEFQRNSAIEIRFGAREPAPSKLRAIQRIITGSSPVNQQ